MICVSTNTRAASKIHTQMSANYVCTPLENKMYFLHHPGKISAGAHVCVMFQELLNLSLMALYWQLKWSNMQSLHHLAKCQVVCN